MAEQTTFTLKGVVDLDTAQAIKNANKLKATLDDAVRPRPGASAKATADKASGMGETKTARSIGAGGGTGSAASDFAAQAQGLGGLVHLYATFAANIFAVSAAFNALSKAMDVTNLVKGLDQIGASTGRNLGSLAKQMVAVADGAISMQQAMTSTAMASSGGMTNQAILRMTEVAKKASLALGRDMSDSMDRLTKGIVKTQPELLDELGIMTRMIPAQQEYARQIGKTIGSLTDFEKRQAFANAVLAEGEKKFGAINLDANPYSKISASITNLMQSGLELVNKVLGPLVNTLSQSPTGLALVLGGLASILVKQAMPAIGMFRENAKRMEAETHARVTNQVKEQQAAAIASDAIIAAKATRDYQVSEASAKAISELPKRFNKKIVGDEVRGLLAKSPYDLSDTDMATIKAKQDELAASTDKKHQDQATNIKKRYEGNLAIQKAALDAGYEATIVQIDKDEKAWTHASMKKRELDKLTAKAASSSVLAKVADTAAIQGPAIAFKLLREETSKLDMNGLAKGVTLVKGSFSILTSAVSTAMNAFGVWAQVIGLVLAGISLLDGWLSTSAKTSEAFNGALDTLNSSFENIDRTLEVIRKKDLSEFLSVESTQAKANALNDLTGNLEDTVGKFTKLISAQSGWDKFLDSFWDMFGKGSADKLSLGISKTVVDAFTLMEEGPAKKKAQDAINALTKDVTGKAVDMSTVKSFNEGIKDLDSSKIEQIGKITAKALSEASRSINNGASALTSFKTALTEVGKQATTISNSLVPKDDFSKLGVDLNTAASSMATALQDPINGLIALKELSGDLKTLSFLPPDLAVKLGSAKQEIDDVTNALAATKKELANATSKVNTTKDRLASAGGVASDIEKVNLRGSTQLQVRVEAEKTLAIETQGVEVAKAKVKWAEEAANTTRESFKGIAVDLAKAAYNNLALGLNKALAEASITAAKGYLDTIKSAGGFTAQMDAELSKQQISIQIEDIKTRYSNTIALADLTLEVRKNTMIQERSAIASDIREQKGAKSESQTTRLDTLDKGIKEVELAQKIAKSGSTAIRNNARDASSKGADDTLRNAMGMLTDVVAQSFGKDSQLAKLFADMGNAELQKKAGAITDASNIKKQGLTNEGKNLTTSANDLANVQAINGMYNSQLQTSKELINQAQLKNKYALEEEDITAKIAINQIALDKFKKEGNKDSKGLAEAERNAGALQTSLATTRLEKATQLGVLESKNFQERKLGEQQLKDIQNEQEKSHRQYILDIKAAEDTAIESKLSYFKELGILTESEFTKQSASIKAAAEERRFNEEILNLKQAQGKEQDAIQAKIDAAKNSINTKTATFIGPVDTSAENAVIAQQTKLLEDNKTKSNEIVTAKTLQNTATAEAIALQNVLNISLAEQKKTMEDMVSITMSLTSAFDEVGTSIGKAMETVTKFAQTEQKYTTKKLAAQEELKKAKNDSQITAAQKKLAKLEDKHTEDQLDGIAEIAGATKKMFDEKSAAHKAFSAIEKVTAAASLALKVQSMASDIASMATSIPAAIGKLFAQGGWAGFAGAAAFLAMIGQGGGGSDFTMPGGISSADRQETQGTGMSWVDGKKVENGSGTFGDSSAKSTSIVDSLEVMKKNSIVGLDYNNKMLKAMQSVADAIGTAAQSIYQIPGIRLGSAFGTTEGTSGGSFLGWGSSTSTSVQDSGIKIAGTFSDIAKSAEGTAKLYETILTQTSSSSWFGLVKSSSSSVDTQNKTLNDDNQKAISDIFTNATKVFVEIGKTAGITEQSILSTLGTLPISVEASLRGLTGKDLETALNATIGTALSEAAKAIFSQFDQYKKFGEDYLATTIRVVDGNKKLDQSLRSMGNTFDVISKFDVSESLIKAAGGLENFMEQSSFFTDTFLTDAERLAPVQKSVNAELTRLKISTDITRDGFKNLVLSQDLNTESGRELYQSLMDLAPGFDKVHEASKKVLSGSELEAALKEQEIKLLGLRGFAYEELIVQRAKDLSDMQEELKIGQQLINVQEDLNKTNSLKLELLTAEGKTQEVLLYQRAKELIALSDNDKAIKRRIWALQDETKLADARSAQEVKIYNLLGNSAAALAITREKELTLMDEQLRPAQKYIYALEDEAALKSKLKTAYDKESSAIKTTLSNIQGFIRGLKDAKDSLLLSDKSILTPAQKYAEAKQQAYQVAAIATGIATTDKEIAARNDAISKLPSVTGTFLDASRTLYASSEQYTQDFNSVLNLLDSTSASLIAQETDSQKQLNALDTSNSYLNSIASDTESSASILAQLLAASATTEAARAAAAASGSVASGGSAIPGGSGTPSARATVIGDKIFGTNGYTGTFAETKQLFVDNWNDGKNSVKILELLKSAGIDSGITSQFLGLPISQVQDWAAKNGVPGFAKGGLASGLAMVGEQGPELVDFKTPGRVYSNVASNQLLSNKELIQEIRNLRKEVSDLRAEQKEQTGHLIQSNYEANANAAKKVVDATEEASSADAWNKRSMVKIA